MSPAWLCLAIFAADANSPVDFASQVIPVLTKAGCNAGACHGAAAGRGGFHLSLFGSDPVADFGAIVHDFEGRRINLARPESSLLLAKPTGQLDHGGDVPLEEGGAGAKLLLTWIKSGAPPGTSRRLKSIEISPRERLCDSVPALVPLQAIAQFDNEPPADVTEFTVFTSSDPAAVEVDPHRAVATVRRRGKHVIVARFLDRVVPLQIVVPLSDSRVDLTGEPRANFIDERVLQMLGMLRLPVSPAADDAMFLRRVRLDLTGRLPEPEEVEAFLADRATDKRAQLVERLLSSDAFADYWTLRFARLLRLHSLPNEKEGAGAYTMWLRQHIHRGTPLDEMARQLLTATGDSHAVGPANFPRMVADARSHAELVGQFFLGVRLGCANCHNHPLDRWTQDDYHGLAAIFARLDRGREVRVLARGAVTNLRTGEPAVPRIPSERYLSGEADHRVELAQWLTSSDNRYFAKALVNRLWQAMFGRGLVEPANDLRETNPATHPELLEQLTQDFAGHGYDMRHTLRQIALSQTYARSDAILDGNAADDRYYSHAYRRPLAPEVFADAISDVTGVPTAYDGHPLGTRAVTLVDPLAPAPSLDILGRCSRAVGCDDDQARGGGLPAQLHMLNGELINRKLVDQSGRLHRLISAGKTDSEIITEHYLRALGRRPTTRELQRWCDLLASPDSTDRTSRLEDFTWGLLNSRQFAENH